jgi:hypothetical protein
MTGAVLAALGVGIALFVACSALSLRLLGGPVLIPRLVALAVMGAGLGVAWVVAAPPAGAFGVVAAVLLGIVLVEARTTPVEVVPLPIEGGYVGDAGADPSDVTVAFTGSTSPG